MRIAIDIDGVLRDTFLKIEQIYQKFFIDELELVDDDFKYEIIEPYDTPNYENHFKFKITIFNKLCYQLRPFCNKSMMFISKFFVL